MISLLVVILTWFPIILIGRIVLSWFPVSPGSPLESVQRVLITLTEWCLAPLRRVLPPVRLGAGALDLSPMVVILLCSVLRNVLVAL